MHDRANESVSQAIAKSIISIIASRTLHHQGESLLVITRCHHQQKLGRLASQPS